MALYRGESVSVADEVRGPNARQKLWFNNFGFFRMSSMKKPNALFKVLSPVLVLGLSGCAVLHHVQVGSIDNRNTAVQIPFEILMSEVGVSTEEIGGLLKASNTQGGDDAAGIAALISLFQMGPRTGNVTYNQRFAEKLIYEIYQKCPSGNVTGLMSIREMRKYPAVSGEIVKVTGFCRKARQAPPADVSHNEIMNSNKGDI
ncbi:hypothetical protein predicted by Glimmer/Critica [Bdellovibrio bacteriovorus HD100]|uniref:Uncharacterized protein n=2 Tax=Bdellovibrio bacteriovorus TaxID=959 RepID=Q6MQY3_BDEBA|nr:hypothetical protein predicted by Glimmer/Critica [Bdellovibrio bacteriovorus HD100]